MGFWSFVGTTLATAAAGIAMVTPVGWVGAIALGTAAVGGAAITAVDQINEAEKREEEESNKRIEEHEKWLVNVGDTEAKEDLKGLMELCTEVENKQDLLAKDKVPAGEEASTLKAIQDGIRELREGLVAWTSPLNPHKDKYDSVIGSLWSRVQHVAQDHERSVCFALSETMKAGLNDLDKAGKKLLDISKEEGVELTEKGQELLRRYERKVPGDEIDRINEIQGLIDKANRHLDEVGTCVGLSREATKQATNKELDEETRKGHIKTALDEQKKAEEAKEKADESIIKLTGLIKNLSGNTPPSVFSDISQMYIKSATYQDTVNENIKPVLDIQIDADANLMRHHIVKVDFAYINKKSNEYLKEIKSHYEEYKNCLSDNSVKARYRADYAKYYLTIVDNWISAATRDETLCPSWLTTRAAINFANFFGKITGKVGWGGETASIKEQIRELVPKVGAATQIAALKHESRFKKEQELAFSVLGNNAEMTRQINTEIASARLTKAEKEQEQARLRAKEAQEQEQERLRAKEAREREQERLKAEKEKEKARIAEEQARLKAEKEKEKARIAKEAQEQEQERLRVKEAQEREEDLGLDLPSVPTTPPTKVVQAQEREVEEPKAPLVETDTNIKQVSERKAEESLPLSEAQSEAFERRIKEDLAEKEAAITLGIGESVYTKVKRTKEEKKAKEILDNLQVEKEIRLRNQDIEAQQKRSEEAYKEWKGLSNEVIRERFERYAKAFYRVYSSRDGSFKGTKEGLKTLDELCNNDLGLHHVHSFLSTWSPLGLVYNSQSTTNEQEKLDTLYSKCLLYLRENKQYTEELLALSNKGKEEVTSHAFEVLSDRQKARVIGINNYLNEAKVLNKKLPKDSDVLTASKSYISKIRSELQKINTKVEQLNNALKLLGFEVDEPANTLSSFSLIKGSEEILEAGYTFPALSTLKKKSEYDPDFSQLFAIFIEDFRNPQSDVIKDYFTYDVPENEGYANISDAGLDRINSIKKDIDRLSPLSSFSKIANKEGGDPSSMLDYEKIGDDKTISLSEDLDKRFKDLTRWRGWVQLPPAKPVTLPRTATLEPSPDREREQRNTEEQLSRISYSQPSSEGIRVAVDPEGRSRILKGDEEPRTNERLELVEERCVHIPCGNSPDAFNSTMGKKRRIFKVSVRVINTADLLVGILGFPLFEVEELKGTPKTGEFDVLVSHDTMVNPTIVIEQHTGAPFCLTSITAHMDIEA